MNKNEYIICTLLVVFALVFGLWVGYGMGHKTPYNPALEAAKENSDDSFDAGWRAAQMKVADSGAIISQPEVHTLNGTVKQVGSGEFMITSSYVSRNPLADAAPEERVVKVTKATKIYKKRKRSATEYTEAHAQYREDMRAYREALTEGDTSVRPPRPVLTSVNEDASLSDLADGQKVSVQNLSENIEYSNEFTAEVVYIIE